MAASGDPSLRDYGLAAPHGPNMTGQHVATSNIANNNAHDMSANEREIFNHLILPNDSYDHTGTYWADMNIGRRAKFVNGVDSAEARKELTSTWRMFKRDPLSPVSYYSKNMILPGAGLLLEGYVQSDSTSFLDYVGKVSGG
ncbi:MAG: hypothetical protein Q9159_001792 [Coniocarpon cinnabarinum]